MTKHRATRRPIDTLEPRRLLAGASIDAGGLPREVTQVGDAVYFALDDQADGHLSYVDLKRMDVKTGNITSIRRADGKRFGAVPYTLQKAGDRLLIVEDLDPTTKVKAALWSVRPGQDRARRLVDNTLDARPEQVRTSGTTVYFAAGTRGNVAIYNFDHDDDRATRRVADRDIDPKANIESFVPHRGGLALYVVQFGTAVRNDVYFTADGSAKGLRRIHRGQIESNWWSSPTTPVIGSFGDRLAFGVDSNVYTIGPNSPRAERYVPAALPGVTSTSLWAIEAGRAHVRGYRESDKRLVSVWTDFTSRGTVVLDERAATVGWRETYRVGDALYVAAGARVPEDPETVGKYQPPKGYDVGYSDLMALARNYGNGATNSNLLCRIDVKTGRSTTLLSDGVDVGIGHLTSVGDTLYFQRVVPAAEDGGKALSELWQTDGTAAGTRRLGKAFSTPVNVDGQVRFTSTYDSTRFVAPPPVTTAAIRGRVVRDDARAKVLTDAMAGEGEIRLFVDYDDDKRRDAHEPAAQTDYTGGFTFPNVRPGTYAVRLTEVGDWDATRGTSKTVKLAAGRGADLTFGLADPRRSTIRGATQHDGEARPNVPLWLDLDGNGRRDASDPATTSNRKGGYQFDRLPAGRYSIYFESQYSGWRPTDVYVARRATETFDVQLY